MREQTFAKVQCDYAADCHAILKVNRKQTQTQFHVQGTAEKMNLFK